MPRNKECNRQEILQKMKDEIIKIMQMAGYDFVKEDPESRLLFYDIEAEQDVQLWMKDSPDDSLRKAIELISERSFSQGISIGKRQVANGIKNLLQIP